ncbi:MAG TPA: Rieske 2Fe-2S domain-containing protein [Acidimicrobiia bacterium]|jgi:nitrite reductase/ring-hydroxylating ferredoxin subunit|nr:Rieske 2Fe-2S domain-containing protein [Acidimicrobiia bacterium]
MNEGGRGIGRQLVPLVLGVVVGASAGVLVARTIGSAEPSVVTVGNLSDFAPGSVRSITVRESFFDFLPSASDQGTPAVVKRGPANLFLVRDQTGGVLALLARDTQSRCRLINVRGKPGVIEGVSDAAWFADPCHGASYDQTGTCLAGPCPRGLDRFSVGITAGKVVVDVGFPLLGPARAI